MEAIDCKPCPEGVYCPETGHAYAPIYIDGTDTNVCSATRGAATPNCLSICEALVGSVLDAGYDCSAK